MIPEQLEEFKRILTILDRANALSHLVLVGSWALPVYREKYNIPSIAFVTRDIDFTVPEPSKASASPPLSKALAELGYEVGGNTLMNTERFIFNHLDVEFLCPTGRYAKEGHGYTIKGLGVVAIPLAFQKYVYEHSEWMTFDNIRVRVPNLNYWVFHKLAISQRRKDENKAAKDIDQVRQLGDFIDHEQLSALSDKFKGKFANLFKLGYEQAFANQDPF